MKTFDAVSSKVVCQMTGMCGMLALVRSTPTVNKSIQQLISRHDGFLNNNVNLSVFPVTVLRPTS
jgi:hypothetical protein